MLKDNRLEAEEFELREEAPDHQRALTIAMLVFSLGFCALVFFSGLEGNIRLRGMWLARCAHGRSPMPAGSLISKVTFNS
jgi:hypothetical protein